MFKVLVFVIGLATGAGGAISWLVSKPTDAHEGSRQPSGDLMTDRVETLKSQLREAAEEGKRSGRQTEEELRRRLDSYRHGSGGRLAAP
jgi:hypothetical protein